MMIILQSVSARRISSICRAPERIHLLFFGTDGADIPDIPRVDFGMQQHGENKMRQFLKVTAPATALLALTYVAMAPAAAKYEYCRQDVTSGMRSCSFETMEQCQAMSSGRGGTCYRDPLLTDTSSAYAYQPKHPLSKSLTLRAKKPVKNQ
jgi:uncharacterized protein DUF3551